MEDISGIFIRNNIKPGDMGCIIHLHGVLYAQECGFDCSFEPYVAISLSEFVCSHTDRERIWIVEKDNKVLGSVAIVKHTNNQAQLRWFLLQPKIRGCGLGKRLIEEAIAFCRDCGYTSIFLWTVNLLTVATRLYLSNGFELTEEKIHKIWGVELTEQKYELRL